MGECQPLSYCGVYDRKVHVIPTAMLSRKQKSSVCDTTSILHFGRGNRRSETFKQVWYLRNTRVIQANLTSIMMLAIKLGWGEENVLHDAS